MCAVTNSNGYEDQERALSQLYGGAPDGLSVDDIVRDEQERCRVGKTSSSISVLSLHVLRRVHYGLLPRSKNMQRRQN